MRLLNSLQLSMIKIVLKKITPSYAKEILENRNENNYRTLKKNAAKLYQKDMEDGNWIFNGDTIRFDTDGNLIDGQTRLQAIQDSGIPQKFIIVTGLDPICAKTIDIGFKRSVEDYLRKFEKMYEKGATATVKLALTLKRGNGQIGHSAANARISNAMIVDAYKEDDKHFNEATVFGKEISKKSDKVLKPSHVAGIYYHLVYTKGFDIGKVRMYFEKLSNYNSAGETTPFKTGYQILQDKDGKLGRSGVDIINVYKRVWNSWINGNSKNLISMDKCSNDFDSPKAKKECVVETETVFL